MGDNDTDKDDGLAWCGWHVEPAPNIHTNCEDGARMYRHYASEGR